MQTQIIQDQIEANLQKSKNTLNSHKYRKFSICKICRHIDSNSTRIRKHIKLCLLKLKERKLRQQISIQFLPQQSFNKQNEYHQFGQNYNGYNDNEFHHIQLDNAENGVERNIISRVQILQSKMQKIQEENSSKLSIKSQEAFKIWSSEAQWILQSVNKQIQGFLKQQIVQVLHSQANPETFQISDRKNMIQHIVCHIKNIKLSGCVQSWKVKLDNLLGIKQKQTPPISKATLFRYKAAKCYLERFTQQQILNQNLLIISLIKQSEYIKKGCIEFISQMVRYSIGPPNLRYLPKKLLMKKKSSSKKVVITIQMIRQQTLNLLSRKQYQLSTDLWSCTTMGLRKPQFLKLSFKYEDSFIDIVKVQERKNKNWTTRPVVSSLKKLLRKTKVSYPITVDRFNRLQQYCLKKFNCFYGLRSTCITTIMSSLLKNANLNIHRRNSVTIDYYIDNQNLQILESIFSFNPTSHPENFQQSKIMAIYQLGQEVVFQKIQQNVVLSIGDIQQLLRQEQQLQNEENLIQTVRIEAKNNQIFHNYDAVSKDNLSLICNWISCFKSNLILEQLQKMFKLPFWKVLSQYYGVKIIVHELKNQTYAYRKYEPSNIMHSQSMLMLMSQEHQKLNLQSMLSPKSNKRRSYSKKKIHSPIQQLYESNSMQVASQDQIYEESQSQNNELNPQQQYELRSNQQQNQVVQEYIIDQHKNQEQNETSADKFSVSITYEQVQQHKINSLHIIQVKRRQSPFYLGKKYPQHLVVQKKQNSLPDKVKTILRQRIQSCSFIFTKPSICIMCKSQKSVKQCTFHVKCQRAVLSCRCGSPPCQLQQFQQVPNFSPLITSSRNVIETGYKRIKFLQRQNNILKTIASDRKIYTKKYRYGSLIKNKLKINLPIANIGAQIEQIIKKQPFLPIKITQISATKGRGVVAVQKIPKNTLIACYLGEIRCHHQYPPQNDSIVIIGWDENNQYSVCPQIYSNVGRFLNSCDEQYPANCVLRKCLYPTRYNTLELIIYFVSKATIQKYEQLLYQYGDEYWDNSGQRN